MNYMPTKSRKWLASGIATAVIASALSLFVAVAPASANTATLSVSKAVRALADGGVTVAVGKASGSDADDTTALIIQLDDSFGDIADEVGTGDDDTKIYLRVTDTPSANGTDDSGIFSIHQRDSQLVAASADLAIGAWTLLSESKYLMSGNGADETLTKEDTRVAINFSVNIAGSYTVQMLFDADGTGSAVPTSGDVSASITFTAYGAPAITITSAATWGYGEDETLTITATGGGLSNADSITVADDSTFMHGGFMAKLANARTRAAATYLGGSEDSSLTAGLDNDDTLVIDIENDWRFTSPNVMTLTLVVKASTNDVVGNDDSLFTRALWDGAGTLKAYVTAGFATPLGRTAAVSTTFTADTQAVAIKSVDITAPTTNIIEDDTHTDGIYVGTYLKSATTSGSTTVSGTFQLANVADYGKVVTVAVYDESASTVTVTDTPILTSSITTVASTGVGTWTFAVPNQYLDASGDVITIYVGPTSAAEAGDGTGPNSYMLTATSANITPVWTVNGVTFKASEDFPGTLIVAPGATINASVKTVDQYNNVITGQSVVLYTTTTDRNASKRVQSAVSTSTGTVSVSMTDAGTTVSTTTGTTRDAVKLAVVDGLEDDTVGSVESVTVAYYSANTLTAPTLNGVAAAAYDGTPVVPGDGTADLYSSADRDGEKYDDSLMKFDVTSSVLGASVVFTGTSGVRFHTADTIAPIAGSNIGGSNTAMVALKGTNKVAVTANGTTGVATVYWYCVTVGNCTVTATAGAATATATATYATNAAFARNIVDVKVNDAAATSGTSSADKKVKVSFKVTDIFGNAVKTFGDTPTVDVMVSGVGSIDGLGSQGTLKTGTDGTAQFYAASSSAGSMQITLDGTGGQFAGVASTTLGTSAAADLKTVTITWSAAPAPEVVYAAPTLTVTKSGTKIILDGTAVEGEGDIIVYIKRVGTTKWVEQAATIEVAAPGDYNGMRIAPKSNVLIRVKQEGTGKFSNQVVVLK